MPVITGAMQYPEDVIGKLQRKAKTVAVDALKLAEEAGNSKAVNTVLMGVLSNSMDISEKIWAAAIEKTVPSKLLDINRRAFELGKAYKA